VKKVAAVLAVSGLAGLEILVLFFAGTAGSAVPLLSLFPLLLGIAGIVAFVRSPVHSPQALFQQDSASGAIVAAEPLLVPAEKLSTEERTALPAGAVNQAALKGELELYQKSLPAFFLSIVEYLNKTTEPMSESLVVIKKTMKDFIVQVQTEDQDIVNSETLDLMTGNVNRLQVNINQVAQKSAEAFNVFGSEFQSLKDVLDSIFRLTGDISEIAERVHVLSINASIESARAGIHGRGFKIIADEIQKLAHETQRFLKDIKITAGTSKDIFSSVDRELEDNRTHLDTMLQKEKDTFDTLNGTIVNHYGQFKNLYSGIVQFVNELEGNMNALFPLSMLHAIIIQEVENLDLVTQDFMALANELCEGPMEAGMKFEAAKSVERLRKRLTTSRELDALDGVIRSLGLSEKIDLKRSSSDFELF
jgi:hypothetical protein